ncbi:MAG: holo-ACP synthase [Negativicutes bacterium]|nr:holo-ACP synthase [Negativicutes bacterium]
MILGIGIDIIEIERVRAALERERFAQRVFTDGEQAYCEGRGGQRFASYAARFAGKEAVLKALGTGLVGGQWRDIEILPDVLGAPSVNLSGFFLELARQKGVGAIHISLTHAREYAAAQVIIWGGAADEGCHGSRNAGD